MNEIQKNWKLILASVVFVIIILIGFITLRKPDLKFKMTVEQAAALLQNPELEILPAEVNAKAASFVIVDLRTPNEFLKGSIPGSVNIPEPSLFDTQNIEQLDLWDNQASTIVLVGRDQSQAAGPWMLLRQMGYENLKILTGGWNQYIAWQQNPSSGVARIGQPRHDFTKIMESAKPGNISKTESEKKEVVVPTRKAKKAKAEGGC
jgi:rhodanese-related sulfurtransferase